MSILQGCCRAGQGLRSHVLRASSSFTGVSSLERDGGEYLQVVLGAFAVGDWGNLEMSDEPPV